MANPLTQLIPAALRAPLRSARDRLRGLVRPLEELPDAPDLFRDYRHLVRHPDLERRPGGWVYKGAFYPDYLTVGGASHAIFDRATRVCIGSGIDVGAAYWPLPGAIPVDAERGPGAGRTVDEFADGSLDFVFSSHCLEHIDDWRAALAAWVRKVRPGGVVFLYLPHPECEIWHPGSPMVGDGHKWIPTPALLADALTSLGCEVTAREDAPDLMRSFHVVARKSPDP